MVCMGRGWVRPSRPIEDSAWPERCRECSGNGKGKGPSLHRVSRLLGENYKTLRRVDELRSRPSTCARVFERAQALVAS